MSEIAESELLDIDDENVVVGYLTVAAVVGLSAVAGVGIYKGYGRAKTSITNYLERRRDSKPLTEIERENAIEVE